MKNIRKVLICMIILNIILIILQFIIFNKNSDDSQEIGNLNPKTVEEDNKIYPQNSYKFTYLYDGEVSTSIMYERLYEFINYMELINAQVNNLSDSELTTYFNTNKKAIQYKTGIKNVKQFTTLVNQMKKCDIEDKYQNIEMVDDTYVSNTKNCSIQMNIFYKNGNAIKVIASLNKEYSADDMVKFIPVEEE